jgi:hypothetical protein
MNLTIGEDVSEMAWKSVNKGLETLSPDQVDRVISRLICWLVVETRKLPLPDLDQRINEMTGRIQKMAEDLSVKVNGKVIEVTAKAGKSSDTLALLARGSSWFDGHPNIEIDIGRAVFNEQ